MRAAAGILDDLVDLVGEDLTVNLLRQLLERVREAAAAFTEETGYDFDCGGGALTIDPAHGPSEPPGMRVDCPGCERVEYVTLTSDQVFRLASPVDKGTALLACPCGTEFPVSFR